MYIIVGTGEMYSGTQKMEVVTEADPVVEWTASGGETGLEESMWQFGIGGRQEPYPERPEAADCMYYLRTGYCGYGARCRFNHPRDRGPAVGAMKASGREYPDRAGQPVCQFYMKTGDCKFGASCKYHHPQQGGGSQIPAALNVHGYPLRPGEKECSYYVKTAECKFGVTCKFHHPQPVGVQMAAPVPGPIPAPAPSVYPTAQPLVQSSQPYGVVSGNWSVATPTLLPGSYVPGTYGPVMLPPGMFPVPGWSSYPAPVSPVASASTQPTAGASPIYGLSQLYSSAPAYTGQYLSASPPVPSGRSHNEIALPEKPGQVECQHYLRTGECKFGASCRYRHPPEWNSQKENFALSPMGLPIRPGEQIFQDAPICLEYAENRVCPSGPSCGYNHPMVALSYSSSASSLPYMPVAPYPIRSSMVTLAPSSLSSDSRPQLISGSSKKDALSSRMPSVVNSSASIGSFFPKTATISHSNSTKPSGPTTSTKAEQLN